MDTLLTEDTKATCLLCGAFEKKMEQNNQSIQSLTPKEYNNLVQWLIKANLRPRDLLSGNIIGKAAKGASIEEQRLEYLLGRGVQLGFAAEQWNRNGIWLISRSDTDYPARYKEHLNGQAPPLLFGVGDRSLLQGGGLAIVGSRNVDEAGSHFTRHIATLCVQGNFPIVSGGAKGVDTLAMNVALENNGIAIGILADNLLTKSLERSARMAIADGRLLLLSPFHPEAHFVVWTAMARNKLIYAMADYGLVISADYDKGGTWSGAEEELKRKPARPLFVRHEENMPQGNEKLLELGGIPCPEILPSENLQEKLQESVKKSIENAKDTRNLEQESLLTFAKQNSGITTSQSVGTTAPQGSSTISPTVDHDMMKQSVQTVFQEANSSQQITVDVATILYDAFVTLFIENIHSALTLDEISSIFSLSKKQANEWLKKAVNEKKIQKLPKPIRYQKMTQNIQGSLL